MLAILLLGALTKYGQFATPLEQDSEAFSRLGQTDFYKLIAHLKGQNEEFSCSLASVAMVENAVVGSQNLKPDQNLIDEAQIFARLPQKLKQCLSPESKEEISLDDMTEFFDPKTATVKILRFQEGELAQLERILIENEKNQSNFLIANFDQKTLTEDTEVGHFSPVGAYDEKRKRVLILDVDRRWYAPYWVSLERFFVSLQKVDPSTGKARGLVWVEKIPSKK